MPSLRRAGISLGLMLAVWSTDATSQSKTVAKCFHEDQRLHFGPEGLIVHHTVTVDANGVEHVENEYGDTAQREGWFWVGEWIRQEKLKLKPTARKLSFQEVLNLLEPNRDGIFVRAPMFDAFGRDGKDQGFSRDQMVPLVAAMGLWGQNAALQRMWDAMPEDLLGKHSFNGEWRTFLDQRTSDCSGERKKDCSPQGDCSLKVDKTECSRDALVSAGKCPAEKGCPGNSCATSDCHTECPCGTCGDFNCRVEVCLPGLGCHTECPCGNCGDMNCRTQVCVPGIDLQCQAIKDSCNLQKAADAAACEAARVTCETSKGATNTGFKIEHDACEAGKTAGKAVCEANKSAAIALCEAKKQKFTGDPIGPMGVNLFLRAGVRPISLNPATLAMITNFDLGEVQLLGEIGNRLVCADPNTAGGTCKNDKGEVPEPRANVGDDLNDIIMLLMARVRVSTEKSAAAIALYRGRAHSYGSYFEAVCQKHGTPATDAELTSQVQEAISSGAVPVVSAPYGAVRWYHRSFTGANPALAAMYKPIMEFLLQ
jgi:hypothetical protein